MILMLAAVIWLTVVVSERCLPGLISSLLLTTSPPRAESRCRGMVCRGGWMGCWSMASI